MHYIPSEDKTLVTSLANDDVALFKTWIGDRNCTDKYDYLYQGDYCPTFDNFGIEEIRNETLLEIVTQASVRRECIEKAPVKCFSYLLESGADVHVRNIEGSTPLHYCHPHSMDFFLQNGADIHATNAEGCTPIAEQFVDAYDFDQDLEPIVYTAIDYGYDFSFLEGYLLHFILASGFVIVHKPVVDLLVRVGSPLQESLTWENGAVEIVRN